MTEALLRGEGDGDGDPFSFSCSSLLSSLWKCWPPAAGGPVMAGRAMWCAMLLMPVRAAMLVKAAEG